MKEESSYGEKLVWPACFLFFVNFVTYVQQLPAREIWVKPRSNSFCWMAENQWNHNDWVEKPTNVPGCFQSSVKNWLLTFRGRIRTIAKGYLFMSESPLQCTGLQAWPVIQCRTVSNLFRAGKSTVCQIVLEVCSYIVEVLFKTLVYLPITGQEIEMEIAAFFKAWGVCSGSGCCWWLSHCDFGTNENPEDFVN